MESNQCKKINVSEHFFSYGKGGSNPSSKREKTKKKRSVDNISDINTKNVKELLLQKLKQYKKEQTRKKKTVPETPIDVNFIKITFHFIYFQNTLKPKISANLILHNLVEIC